jgi:hypothetical protein
MADMIQTTAPAAGLQADRAKRTITGQVVPWGTFARISDGRLIAFAPGSLTLSERAKLNIDHDPGRPVGVFVSATMTPDGLDATFKIPAGADGDQILAQAADGLRDGLSVGAEIIASSDTDDGGTWVTGAKGRHVAILSEPAFDTARVTAVAAQKGTTAMDLTASTPTEPAEPTEPEPEPEPAEIRLTAAGAATPRPAPAPAPALVRDPYPYAVPHILGGPSFVRDAMAAMETPGSEGAGRWRTAQAMHADPAYIRAGTAALVAPRAPLQAATGTSTGEPNLTPARWRPDRYVPLKALKAPLWSVVTKYPTPDFNTLMVPRTATETGLSGLPTDEVTPIAPGDITTGVDTVTIAEIEGAYQLSRRLLMGSNPQIDTIALDAMERAWLNDIEARAVAFFTLPAHSTAVAATYADGVTYVTALRSAMANMAVTPFTATDMIPAQKEYVAAATANSTTGAPILPFGPRFNTPGDSDAAFAALEIQGVPLWPGPSMTANHTLVLDQDNANSACAFVTPVMNFRLEWTTDTTTGGNVKVLKLVKYSGVGFWAQQPQGIRLLTNTTPIILEGDEEPAGNAHKK